MSYTVSPILEMQLPVVGSGQAFETVVVNANFLKIDTAVGVLQGQVAAIGSPPWGIDLGGTGATTAAGARTALGSTAVGDALFVAASAAAARTAIGATTVGDALVVAATAVAGREALRIFRTAPGSPQVGDYLIEDA